MTLLTVAGAGAWGTALALHIARAGQPVTLWARDPAPLHATRQSLHLPGHTLPDAVALTGTLPAAGATVLAIPVQHLRATLQGWRPPGPVVLACKGVEAGTGLLPSEILHSVHPGVPVAVLTGPNFAHEVASGMPAAAVVAGPDAVVRHAIALLATPHFRLYASTDLIGAQLGGAAKNVVAIAAGAVVGAGLGENARAALVTRGLAELSRLVVACGGQAATAAGLSGLGDLLLTCTGASSRNFTLGLALGRGEALASVLATRSGVTEGVATAPALLRRAGGTELPVCAGVAGLLAGADLRTVIAALLARPLRGE